MKTPSARYDGRTGQWVPTINGVDASPTSFEKERAVQIAEQIIATGQVCSASKQASADLLTAATAALEYLQAHPPKGKVKDIFTELNHHANGICKPLHEAILKAKGQSVRKNPPAPHHTHVWKTTQSFGVWGHDAQCEICGKKTTFTIREDA